MKRILILSLALLLLVGCGDQGAKDRARQADAEAELSQARADAYQSNLQADAMATQAAVNAEGQRAAQAALATQAAIVSDFADNSLNPATGIEGDGGGLDLVDLAPWVALAVTLVCSAGSLVVSLVTAQRTPGEPEREIVYVIGDRGETALLPEPQRAYLRPLPREKSRARLLRAGRGE